MRHLNPAGELIFSTSCIPLSRCLPSWLTPEAGDLRRRRIACCQASLEAGVCTCICSEQAWGSGNKECAPCMFGALLRAEPGPCNHCSDGSAGCAQGQAASLPICNRRSLESSGCSHVQGAGRHSEGCQGVARHVRAPLVVSFDRHLCLVLMHCICSDLVQGVLSHHSLQLQFSLC